MISGGISILTIVNFVNCDHGRSKQWGRKVVPVVVNINSLSLGACCSDIIDDQGRAYS